MNSVRHRNEGTDVPNTGQSQGIKNHSLTREGEGTRPPGIGALAEGIQTRAPIGAAHVTITNIDAEDINPIAPGSKPQAVAFTQVEPGTSAGLKAGIYTKNFLDGEVRKGVSIQGNDGQRARNTGKLKGRNDRVGPESSC